MKPRALTRRDFLASAACCVALPLSARAAFWDKTSEVQGSILGASFKTGHRLREGTFPEVTKVIERDAVIIGGGIAGLSAAWKLQKSGFSDFMLVEMEENVGGNATSGENSISAYPWGAHYVPLLTAEAKAAHELFRDLGIITGTDKGQPVYNEYYLCSDPHERLYMYGRWQEGMVPQLGTSKRDQDQYKTFFSTMDHFKAMRGADNKRAFAIPLDLSSRDPNITRYDQLSMADYMKQQGWDSPYLLWYVDYCCRDDFGATLDHVSAWAGIHYFAARNGQAANADASTVVTWPEGNGWIVKQLKNQLAPHLQTNALAYAVTPQDGHVEIRYLDVTTNQTIKIKAKSVLLATPRFIANRLTSREIDISSFEYSPWMVANVTIDALPGGAGAPFSWDNMIYESKLLGYVDATHQSLSRQRLSTVLTYYWPLSHLSPSEARQEAIQRPYKEWRDIILAELLKIHPELEGHITHLDVWLWGHGMIRPSPGFIWGQARQTALKSEAPIFHAHSDMSGLSIFEEANYHGVKAAEQMLAYLHHPHQSSL